MADQSFKKGDKVKLKYSIENKQKSLYGKQAKIINISASNPEYVWISFSNGTHLLISSKELKKVELK